MNHFIRRADGTEEADRVLEPPYVATMGSRLSGGAHQIADVTLRSSTLWAEESVRVEVLGLERFEFPVDAQGLHETGVTLSLHYVGDYRIRLTGSTSGCSLVVPITTKVDDVLREYDVRHARGEPPPPDVPDGAP